MSALRARRRKGPAAAVTFAGVEIAEKAFGAAWDHRRGMFARTAAVMLEYDDKELERRLMKDAATAHAALDFYDDLREEIAYLKRHIEMLKTLSARILCVAHRADPSWCEPPPDPPPVRKRCVMSAAPSNEGGAA